MCVDSDDTRAVVLPVTDSIIFFNLSTLSIDSCTPWLKHWEDDGRAPQCTGVACVDSPGPLYLFCIHMPAIEAAGKAGKQPGYALRP